jgi:hypothetical protein
MNREVKRVALEFDWPLFEIWPGYSISMLDGIPDREKDSKGIPQILSEGQREKWSDYFYENRIEPPAGDGWQVWKTAPDGYPNEERINRVFAE